MSEIQGTLPSESRRFAVLLSGAEATTAQELAERSRLLVSGKPLSLFGKTLSMTVSVGVARLYTTTTLAELLESAEEALMAAKRNGCARAQDAGADGTP